MGLKAEFYVENESLLLIILFGEIYHMGMFLTESLGILFTELQS